MQYIASRAGVLYMYESSPLPSLSLPLKSATISCSKDCKVEVRRGREEVLTLLPPPNSALSLSRILSLLCKARDWEDEVVAVVPCTIALTPTQMACLNRGGRLLWRRNLSSILQIASSASTIHLAWESLSSWGALLILNSKQEVEDFTAAVEQAAPQLPSLSLHSCNKAAQPFAVNQR